MNPAVSVRFVFSLLACLWLATPALAGEFLPAHKNGIPNEYIVVLEDHAAQKAYETRANVPSVPEVADHLQGIFGGRVITTLEHAMAGFAIELPEGTARHLSRHPAVRFVEQNARIDAPSSTPYCYNGTSHPTQATSFPSSPQAINCNTSSVLSCAGNWGLDRIDQYGGNLDQWFNFNVTGNDVHVYLVDTGVRGSHSEFQDSTGNSRIGNGHSIKNRYPYCKLQPQSLCDDPANQNVGLPDTDCQGHGTHVASILAGKTYGVAKNATIHPVKINSEYDVQGSDRCSASTSYLITAKGFDWIAANYQLPAIVNYSSNGPPSSTLDTAVAGVIAQGLAVVQSAGNQNQPASSYILGSSTNLNRNDLIVAGASDESDGRWVVLTSDDGYGPTCPGSTSNSGVNCGSNYGSAVDFFSPGAHITAASILGNNAYCRLSGTSMAAPHTAGVGALYLEKVGHQSPAAVKNRLVGKATAYQLSNIGSGSPNLLLNMDTADSNLAACMSGSCSGTTCSLDASCSTSDSGTSITQYNWDFGNGVTRTTYTPYTTYDYGTRSYWFATVEIVVNTGELAEKERCVNTSNIGIYSCIQ